MLNLQAYLRVILLLATKFAFSIPLDSSDNIPPSTNIVFVTNVVTSQMSVIETATVTAPISSDPTITSSQASGSASLTSFSSSEVLQPSPAVITEMLTMTATVTAPISTVTLSEPPETITEIITAPPTTSSGVYFQSTWSAPGQISDLGPFNISSFAYGQTNLQIVDGIPATASATTMTIASDLSSTPGVSAPISSSWDNASSVLQLLYPENSINPGTEPQGGADFYATPLDLHNATSIALEYSVFFPMDFDWVLAGKLPGIFGGHKGCSGGDDAQTCFSTRLMWRQEGAGELYLYAPKDKQTDKLCSTPPLSVCNADYGLSIGRGSFSFTPGTWTHLKQTITLNTPGQQDGGFYLEVNGKPALQLKDVFYRDSQSIPSGPVSAPDLDQEPAPMPQPTPILDIPSVAPLQVSQTAKPSDGINGLLGGLLGGLGGMMYRVTNSPARQFFQLREDISDAYFSPSSMPNTGSTDSISDHTEDTVTTLTITYTQTSTAVTTAYEPYYPTYYPEAFDFAHVSEPAGFIGMFFSTFFGGHDSQYATPRDQYAWFKDFAMSINPQARPTTTPSSIISASSMSNLETPVNASSAGEP
ncbi:hypothetical protein QCA50_007582 [Cerrena zonata]|uniref:Polysaccharide lyase 14 domain-containing protein n=1 Tax=Cerrena zonata TaxID=2478898 RepID=A0AAW0GHG4_9APHY